MRRFSSASILERINSLVSSEFKNLSILTFRNQNRKQKQRQNRINDATVKILSFLSWLSIMLEGFKNIYLYLSLPDNSDMISDSTAIAFSLLSDITLTYVLSLGSVPDGLTTTEISFV